MRKNNRLKGCIFLKMVFEIIIIVLLIFALCVVGYRGAIHEFQILQKEYEHDINWSEPLSERLPLVIRNLPQSLTGNWTFERTQAKSWPTQVQDAQKRRLRTTWNNWIVNPENTLTNGAELAKYAKLDKTIGNWLDFRRWFWIPVVKPVASVLTNTQCQGIRKATAEATVIVSTDGSPLDVWISHEDGIPGDLISDISDKDPWIQTTNEIPGISEVKYIEIKLRPNNALVIPSHWWYALRSSSDSAMYWTAEFHSPVSYLATKLKDAGN